MSSRYMVYRFIQFQKKKLTINYPRETFGPFYMEILLDLQVQTYTLRTWRTPRLDLNYRTLPIRGQGPDIGQEEKGRLRFGMVYPGTHVYSVFTWRIKVRVKDRCGMFTDGNRKVNLSSPGCVPSPNVSRICIRRI